jgi:DNA mismatch repair ATPase MutS
LKVANQLSTEEKIKQHFPDLTFLSKVNAIQLKTSFISFEKHLTGEFAAVFWLLLELIKIQFMIEYIIFYSFIDSINNQRENIDSLFQFIGKVDAAISTASLKSGAQEYCEPVFVSNKYISTKDIQHPLITNCIPNSICLDGKSLLLTGSNMSGKTTFIRTIALNAVLAQTLNICYAKEYSAQFLKIHSSIRITDSLLNDTSYYLKEVLTIKDLITASKDDSPCLFILDEIFKGTNTIERVSGGKAILSYLNQSKHIVLVSTHDIELTEMLEKDNYDLYHFNESIDDEKLHFDHKLKPGKLKTRNAIKILELYDYPESIVSEARRTEKESFG